MELVKSEFILNRQQAYCINVLHFLKYIHFPLPVSLWLAQIRLETEFNVLFLAIARIFRNFFVG